MAPQEIKLTYVKLRNQHIARSKTQDEVNVMGVDRFDSRCALYLNLAVRDKPDADGKLR